MHIFTKIGCGRCEVLKRTLNANGVKYTTTVCKSLKDAEALFEDENIKSEIRKQKMYPVVVDGSWVGSSEMATKKYAEELLQTEGVRHSLYPIKYNDVYDMYKKARASYWQPEEISLAKDLQDWEKMTHDEKHFVKHVLAFFSASDGIVNENLNVNFSKEIHWPEVRAFFAFQEAIEAVHSETYSIILDKLVSDPKEKLFLQDGVKNIPSIKKKASWAFKHMNQNVSFARRLLAFACVEGINFSGSFCAIYWLKKRNLMSGLAFSNELISRDEGLHTEFSILLYKKLNNRLSQDDVYSIVKEAVENEKEFVTVALPCRLIGMNDQLMCQYIEFVADRLLVQLGYPKVYNVECPFDFMETISLNGKTNFFEKRVGEYAKAGVMHGNSNEFALDASF